MLGQSKNMEPQTDAFKKDKALWKSMNEANFTFSASQAAGNPMASRWDRATQKDAKLLEAYKKKGYANKQRFRAEWAAKEHKKCMPGTTW